MPSVCGTVTVTTSTPCPLPDYVFNQYSLADNFPLLCSYQGIILSGGQRQRIGVARALYQTTNVVFLVGPDTCKSVKRDVN